MGNGSISNEVIVAFFKGGIFFFYKCMILYFLFPIKTRHKKIEQDLQQKFCLAVPEMLKTFEVSIGSGKT